MSVGVGSNGAEQDKAINAGLFGSGERSFPGLASIKRIHLDLCTRQISQNPYPIRVLPS